MCDTATLEKKSSSPFKDGVEQPDVISQSSDQSDQCSEYPALNRRTHKKSRNGCSNCEYSSSRTLGLTDIPQASKFPVSLTNSSLWYWRKLTMIVQASSIEVWREKTTLFELLEKCKTEVIVWIYEKWSKVPFNGRSESATCPCAKKRLGHHLRNHITISWRYLNSWSSSQAELYIGIIG